MTRQREFIWFGGAAFDAILSDMQVVAADPDRRIEFHVDKKTKQARVFVEPQTRTEEGGGGGTNDSHICPPQCP